MREVILEGCGAVVVGAEDSCLFLREGVEDGGGGSFIVDFGELGLFSVAVSTGGGFLFGVEGPQHSPVLISLPFCGDCVLVAETPLAGLLVTFVLALVIVPFLCPASCSEALMLLAIFLLFRMTPGLKTAGRSLLKKSGISLLKKLCNPGNCSRIWLSSSFISWWVSSTKRWSRGK